MWAVAFTGATQAVVEKLSEDDAEFDSVLQKPASRKDIDVMLAKVSQSRMRKLSHSNPVSNEPPSMGHEEGRNFCGHGHVAIEVC